MHNDSNNHEDADIVIRHWETIRGGIELGFSRETVANVVRFLEEFDSIGRERDSK